MEQSLENILKTISKNSESSLSELERKKVEDELKKLGCI